MTTPSMGESVPHCPMPLQVGSASGHRGHKEEVFLGSGLSCLTETSVHCDFKGAWIGINKQAFSFSHSFNQNTIIVCYVLDHCVHLQG